MGKIGDHLWLWCHQASSHDGLFGLSPCDTPPDMAARTLGIDNGIMVCFDGEPHPPFAPHAEPLAFMDRLVWSIVGDSSSTRNDEASDLDAVLKLAEVCPNIVGGIMDDFFHPVHEQAEKGLARYTVADVTRFRDELHGAVRPLDLWVVVYDQIMDCPLSEHLAPCDVITFWTWCAKSLPQLEVNMAKLEAMAPAQRKMLGCYMWDYGDKKPMPLDAMQRQCEIGLDWLREGRIDGIILLGSNLHGLDLDTVAWTQDWIADMKGESQ